MLSIGSSANSKAYAKYNAKSGRWSCRPEGGEEREVDTPTFVCDFYNIQTGWFRFREGQGPERAIDPSLQEQAQRPAEDYKRGFAVRVFSDHYFGGAVELSSSSLHLCNAIRDIYAEFLNGRTENRDCLPVIECSGTVPSKDKFGTNYKPLFRIVKFVERPEQLPDEPAVSEEPRAESVRPMAQHTPTNGSASAEF